MFFSSSLYMWNSSQRLSLGVLMQIHHHHQYFIYFFYLIFHSRPIGDQLCCWYSLSFFRQLRTFFLLIFIIYFAVRNYINNTHFVGSLFYFYYIILYNFTRIVSIDFQHFHLRFSFFFSLSVLITFVLSAAKLNFSLLLFPSVQSSPTNFTLCTLLPQVLQKELGNKNSKKIHTKNSFSYLWCSAINSLLMFFLNLSI